MTIKNTKRLYLTDVSCIALSLSLFLISCSNIEDKEKSRYLINTMDGTKANSTSMLVAKRTYSAVENLIEKSQVVIDRNSPLLVSTIVNVNKLEESSGPGRMITEQISGRIVQLGYKTIEPKLRNGLTIQGSGELILSRDIKLLKSSFPAQAVVSGTYAVGNDQVSINLKLIELSEGRILSSTDYTLPTSDWYNF
jgi:TolB-like protein